MDLEAVAKRTAHWREVYGLPVGNVELRTGENKRELFNVFRANGQYYFSNDGDFRPLHQEYHHRINLF